MAIYLGDKGHVEIGRQQTSEPLYTTLVASDVTTTTKRFSVMYASGALSTGDYISIRRIQVGDTEQNLELVDGHEYPDWAGYCHIDAVGGIRLYDDFAEAIDGGSNSAVALMSPTVEEQELKIETRAQDARCLGQVQNFEISTSRETVDITVLSNQFRNQLKNGLISGQGRLNCFWEHRTDLCEITGSRTEFSAYLAKLCVRLQQGAAFDGLFYLYDGGETEPSVWYEADCIVTNVSVSVSATEMVESVIDFITTGPVQLRTGIKPLMLLLEDDDFLLQERGDGRLIAAINED
jgi:hypothetical protein